MKPPGAKTELSKYSSKYALNELLVCGECGTPFKRCTWCKPEKKKIMWRCISRVNFGKQYCHNSPSIEESVLHQAIMTAILEQAQQNVEVLTTLRSHIELGINAGDDTELMMEMEVRIAQINADFQRMLKTVSSENADIFDDEKLEELMQERHSLQRQLDALKAAEQHRKNNEARVDEIFTILDGLKNHPMEYDDQIARQILECVIVESKEKIRVVFIGGLEVEQQLDYIR